MREIDLNATSITTVPKNTFLVYGDTRTGKTTFAATFPRPLFLSDISEKGYEALTAENWNNNVTPLFEEDVKPMVWGIDRQSDMAEAVLKVEPLIKSGRVQSIWVDSISFYSDLYLNATLIKQEKLDTRAAYGALGVHLRDLRIKLHGLGVNVGWLALAKHPEEDDKVGRPMIPGQQADKFSAGVDFIFHTRLDQPMPAKPATFQIRTKRYLSYIAGNRLGGRANLLPDPFHGNYTSMMTALGYDVDAMRAALPKISSFKAQVVTSATVKTPPVITRPVTTTAARVTVVTK